MAQPPFPVPPAVLRGVLKVHLKLQDLLDRSVPPEMALFDMLWGVQRTAIAGALVTTGIADALGEGAQTAAELADRLGLDPEVTLRVLRGATVSRLVVAEDGGFSLSRIGGPLRRDHPASIANWAATQATPSSLAAYGQLDAMLRGGAEPSAVRRALGTSMWEHYAKNPNEGAHFGQAMRELTAFDLDALVRAYPWPKDGVVCDVAGGIGTMLAEILERNPGARGVLVDAPEVLAESEEFLRSKGVFDRVERRTGDIFGDLDANADIYVMKWILHDWSDEKCREILGRVRATMPKGAKVVVIDQHLDLGRSLAIASIADVHMMHVCEGGRERTPDEVFALLRDAGLTPGKVRHAGLHMLVEGVARS